MAQQSSGEMLEALFTRLNTQLKNQQNKKALKAVDEILKIAPKDGDALKSKAVILINTGKFEEVLDLVKDSGLETLLAFEKAYAYYRLGQYPEALTALELVGEDNVVAKLQLQAQLYYRQGKNAEAINLYNQLYQKHKVSTSELHTNVLAAYISGKRGSEVPAVMEAMKITAKDSPDVAFNKACSLMESQQYEAAESELLLAQRLGLEMLMEEEAGEEETEEELAPMAVQLAFIASQLGRHGEALEAYQDVSRKVLADEATNAVAANNLIAERMRHCKEKDSKKLAHDCLKKLEGFLDKVGGTNLKPGLETRMSSQQKEALHVNHALLLLLGNRREAAAELLRALAKRWPQSAAVGMARAALLVREGNGAEADAVLAALPPSCQEAILMRAQLACSAGQPQLALDLLASLANASLQTQPAVVATRVDLLEQVGASAEARKLVEKALASLPKPARGAKPAAQDGRAWLLQRAAELALQVGDTEGALKWYQQLETVDPSAAAGSRILSQLAAINLATGGALQLAQDLPPISSPPPGEVDDLEVAFLGSGRMRKHSALDKKRQTGDEAPSQRKRRKHRKRLPKNFDPENPGPMPDPERWLPKWQRSDYKKKRTRRKEKEAIKGSQGAGKVDEALDRTKNDPGVEAEPIGKGSKPPPGRAGKKKGRR